MVEPDVVRFEIPTELLHEAQEAYTAYRAVLAEWHDSRTHAASADREQRLAAARRRVAEFYERLAVRCVDSEVLFVAVLHEAHQFEHDAADSDAWADWFTEQAARQTGEGGAVA